jgi:hypothetical protein
MKTIVRSFSALTRAALNAASRTRADTARLPSGDNPNPATPPQHVSPVGFAHIAGAQVALCQSIAKPLPVARNIARAMVGKRVSA